jgi:kynureninase
MGKFILEEWSALRSQGWIKADWIHSPQRLGDKLAPLIGAEPGEVVFCDSTSVNIFKLLVGALALRPDRSFIISEKTNFPTDLYIAQGIVRLFKDRYHLRLVDHEDQLPTAIDENTAVLMLTQVDYRTSRRLDMAAINQLAHDKGALVLWDLSHSAGAIPVDLNGTESDLAVGCGYKYLNGGPGAPAFLWVSRGLQKQIDPAITGWIGHAARSNFDTEYRPATGVDRHLVGAPVVLGMITLEAALDIWPQVDMAEFYLKSQTLSHLFIHLVEQECGDCGIQLVSPREAKRRGGHVAFQHKNAQAIIKALDERGVIGGFRLPNFLRFGLAPLSLRYVDIWDAVQHLTKVMRTHDVQHPL